MMMEHTRGNFRTYALGHPFMRELEAGTLSLHQVQGFVLNWYTWVREINSATAGWLHRFGVVLCRHPDIGAVVHRKIADELITPDSHGHLRVLEKLGAALGLDRAALIEAELIPEARAWLSYFVLLQKEGTFAECVAGYLGEGCFPEFAKVFQSALTRHYGLSLDDVAYFVLHGAQDEDHGSANVFILQRLLEERLVDLRPGWSLEYATRTSGQLYVAFLDGVYRRYAPAP